MGWDSFLVPLRLRFGLLSTTVPRITATPHFVPRFAFRSRSPYWLVRTVPVPRFGFHTWIFRLRLRLRGYRLQFTSLRFDPAFWIRSRWFDYTTFAVCPSLYVSPRYRGYVRLVVHTRSPHGYLLAYTCLYTFPTTYCTHFCHAPPLRTHVYRFTITHRSYPTHTYRIATTRTTRTLTVLLSVTLPATSFYLRLLRLHYASSSHRFYLFTPHAHTMHTRTLQFPPRCNLALSLRTLSAVFPLFTIRCYHTLSAVISVTPRSMPVVTVRWLLRYVDYGISIRSLLPYVVRFDCSFIVVH